jgi:hypothetical protein
MNHHFRSGRRRSGAQSTSQESRESVTPLSGRLASAPHHLLHRQSLEPLLPPLSILMAPDAVARELATDPGCNLSDISFAGEQFVEPPLPEALPALMSGRDPLLQAADDPGALARVAGRYSTWVRPGFCLAALCAHPAAESTSLGLILSRFVTALLTRVNSEYNVLALPDDLAGISASMLQKNLASTRERIHGKTGHPGAFSLCGTTHSIRQFFSRGREHLSEVTRAMNLTPTCAIARQWAQVHASTSSVAVMDLPAHKRSRRVHAGEKGAVL